MYIYICISLSVCLSVSFSLSLALALALALSFSLSEMSRQNKVEGSTDDNAVFVFVKMLKARLKIDFNYYSLMNYLEKFSNIWCYKKVLCSVVKNNYFF